MNYFLLMFWHYFKRSLKDTLTIPILFILPIGIIAMNSVVSTSMEPVNGYNYTATGAATLIMLSFQFFCGSWLMVYLYKEFGSDMRWRLCSAPIPRLAFFFAASLGNWIFSIVQGILIIAISALFFKVYWGNVFVLIAVLLLTSIMAQLVAIFLFIFIRKMGTANAIHYVIIFGMMIVSGGMFGSLGDGPIATFLSTHGTPLSLGWRALLYSGFILDDISKSVVNIAIMLAITFAMAAVVVIGGRRRVL